MRTINNQIHQGVKEPGPTSCVLLRIQDILIPVKKSNIRFQFLYKALQTYLGVNEIVY